MKQNVKTINFSDQELFLIKKASQREGINTSAFIRSQALKEAKKKLSKKLDIQALFEEALRNSLKLKDLEKFDLKNGTN